MDLQRNDPGVITSCPPNPYLAKLLHRLPLLNRRSPTLLNRRFLTLLIQSRQTPKKREMAWRGRKFHVAKRKTNENHQYHLGHLNNRGRKTLFFPKLLRLVRKTELIHQRVTKVTKIHPPEKSYFLQTKIRRNRLRNARFSRSFQ